MPSFTIIRAVARLFPTMAAALQIIGVTHPPFCFAPVYTIFPLHFKRIFESQRSRRALEEPSDGRGTPRQLMQQKDLRPLSDKARHALLGESYIRIRRLPIVFTLPRC